MIKGNYLRVQTPLTSDGISPIVKNDRIQYREDHLPTTARKMLERKNSRLPTSLKMKIEEVENQPMPKPGRQNAVQQHSQTVDLNEEVEDLDLTAAAAADSEIPQTRRGRPPRNAQNIQNG